MDAFDEQFSQLIAGCVVALVVGAMIIGGLVLIASHIQWK